MSGADAGRLAPSREFLDACADYGIEFEPGELDALARYLALLLDANQRFNLTTITDPAQAWMRHIFDSLTLLPLVIQTRATTLIDIGSGGGAPGVPLAIVLPAVEITLLEATAKKARFLEAAARELALANVRVVSDRAETVGQDAEAFREHFDVVSNRAVGPLNVVLELAMPLVRVGGLVLAIKGAKAQQELDQAGEALNRLHGKVVAMHRTRTGTIVVIEKLRPTPKRYPRAPGEPRRAPLGGASKQ